MRAFFAFFLLIMTTSATDQGGDPTLSALPKLESLIHQTMHQKKIPGMAVAVVSKGKIIFIRGFGVRTIGKKDPINLKTMFQLGSVSKAISSTLVAILNRNQEISLDQPLDILPEATLRNVLSHTTGLPSAGFNALIEGGATPLEAHQKLQDATLKAEPGEMFAYHNVVYNLITGIIERQIGDSFESILQTKLFKPLQMTQTFSTWEGFMSNENRASPHIFSKTKGKKGKSANKVARKAPYRQEYTNFPAAGGLSSNIHDMALFLSAVMGGRPDVVSAQDLEDFIRPLIHTPDQWARTQKYRDRITETQYGLGWRYMTFAGNPLVFHGGWIRGFSTILAFLPNQQVGIVILQNAEASTSFQLTMQFFDWVLGLPSKKWIK
jgi:beta-lactamase class C